MSTKKLNAVVMAKLIDKITGPARKIRSNVKSLNDKMRKLRKTMKLKGVDERWKRISKRFEKLKMSAKSLGKITGFMTGLSAAAGFLFSKLASGNDRVAKFAKQINWTTDQLQEMRYAAQILASVGNKAFDTSMQRFTRRVAEAAAGTGEAQGALKHLGVTLLDGEGKIKNTSILLEEVADAIQKVKNEQTRNLISAKLFDMEGVALVNMLSAGRKEIKKYREEARRVGAVVDKKTLQQSEQYGDNVTRLTAVLGGMVKRIQGLVLPTVVKLTNKLVELVSAPNFNTDLMAGVNDFLSVLREIKSGIITVVNWVGGWKNATIGLFALLGSGVLLNVITLVALLSKGLFLLGSFALPLVIAGFKWLAVAAALNPIGLLVVGIAAGVGLIVAAAGAIIKHWEPISNFFSSLWDGAKSGFTAFLTVVKSHFEFLTNLIPNFLKKQFKLLSAVVPDFVKDLFPSDIALTVKRESIETLVPRKNRVAVETLTTRREQRRRNQSKTKTQQASKTEVGGELHIKIESDGMPRVKNLRQHGQAMGLRVDTGLAFSGT